MKSGCLQELCVCPLSPELQAGYMILGEPDVDHSLRLLLEAGRGEKHRPSKTKY